MKAVLLAFTLLLLAGCEGPLTMTKDADKTHVVVVVQWTAAEDIPRVCGNARSMGCVLGEQVIVATRPAHWGDEKAFVVLGHELYHVLGAQHN